MAYEVSSSVANSTFTPPIHINEPGGTSSGKDYKGGVFSPDGSKLFIPTDKATTQYAGDDDKGVDIFHSSSASGWVLSDSYESNQGGTNYRVVDIFALSETSVLQIIYGSSTGFAQYCESGSNGWTCTNAGELHSNYPTQYGSGIRMFPNPSRTIAIVAAQDVDEISTLVSGSGGWSLSTSEDVPDSTSNADWQSVTWASDDTVFVGDQFANSGGGAIHVYRLTAGQTGLSSAHWTKIETLAGNASTHKGFGGSGMYYHTGSNTLLVVAADGSTTPLGYNQGAHSDPTGIDLWGYASSSANGYLPAALSGFSKVIEDTVPWNMAGNMHDPRGEHGDRFFALANPSSDSSDTSDYADIMVFESGSSGWKATEVSGSGAYIAYYGFNVSTQASIDSNDTVRIAYANPSYVGNLNPGSVSVLDFNVSATPADTTAPTYSAISLAANNSTVAVTFDEAVFNTNGGSGALEVSDFALSISGGSATLSSATPSSINIDGNQYTLGISLSGTPDGSETLTVQPAAADAIFDAAGNAASTSQSSNHQVTLNDQAGPTISSVAITAESGAQNSTLNEGDTVDITVTFNEAVTVNTGGGTPSIAISVGGVSRAASYNSGTGTTGIVFRYTIASSETTDTDGISIGANAISLNSGTMRDAAGNNATLTHNAVSANSSYKVDTTKPTISSLSVASDNSTVTVTFAENVYASSNGTGDLVAADFTLGLSGGNADSINLNATPSAIAKTSQSVWVLTLNGTDLDDGANGEETLSVDAADNTSIFDLAGNAHTASATTVSLNDTVPITETAETAINAAAGGTVKSGGTSASPKATVTIPAGALESNTTIGVNVAQENDPVQTGLAGNLGVGIVAAAPMISLTPHGTTFSSAVTIEFDLTGQFADACSDKLRLYKRINASSPWFEVPSSAWSCSGGTITFTTKTFSEYQMAEDNNMAKQKLNNSQIARITTSDKVDASSLALTSSNVSTKTSGQLTGTEFFALQSESDHSGAPIKVRADQLSSYFSGGKIQVSASTDNAAYNLVMVPGGGVGSGNAVSAATDTALSFNPSTNLLSSSAALTIVGVASFGTEAQTTISGVGLLSSSATATLANATLDQITVGSVDINGGAIDGATIGATSQSSVKATTLSGSSTLDVVGASHFGPRGSAGGLLQISAAGVLSGSATATLANATLDQITVGSADINGGTIDGAAINDTTIGATTQSSVKATTLSGSSTLHVAGASTFGAGGLASISALGVISGSGDSTIHKITMNQLVASTADINGGSVDGATIGASSQSSVQATTLSGSSTLNVVGASTFGAAGYASISAAGVMSGSGNSTFHQLTADRISLATLSSDNVDIDGGAIDGTTIGATTQSSVKATTISGSGTADFAGQVRFGTENQTTVSTVGLLSSSATATLANATLDQITVGSVDINGGAVDGTTIGATTQSSVKATTLSGSSTLSVEGISSFGPGALTSISAAGVISGSGDSTIHKITMNQLVASTADINGGSVDGATIGATSQSSVKATTLSGSSTLNVEGASSFGPGALVTINAAGVISGSGTSTLHQVTADRVTVNTLDVNTINSNTVTQNVLEVDDFVIVAGVSGSSSDLSNGGFQIGGGAGSDGLGAVVWNDSDQGLRIMSGSTAVAKINSSGLEVASGVVSGSGNSTFHQLTADRISLATLSSDNVDIDGGAIDGTTIGATTQSSIKATTISGSGTADFAGQVRFGTENQTTVSTVGLLSSSATATLANATLDQITVGSADINGGAIDGATIGATTQSSVKATTLSGSSTLDVAGVASFGAGNQLTISAAGLLSGSATATLANATLDRITVGDADINGGAIDGTTIGATSQSSVKATTLSGSSTLNVEGASSFGPGALASISAAGVMSGSATSTFHQATLDRATIKGGDIDVVAVNIDGATDIGGALNKADLLLVDDGADGTNRKSTLERVTTYLQGTGLVTGSSGELKVVPVVATFFSASSNTGTAGGMSSDLVTASLNCPSQGYVVDDSIEVYLNGMLQLASASAVDSATGVLGIFDYQISSSVNGFRNINATEQTSGNLHIHLAAALDADDILTIKYISHGLER